MTEKTDIDLENIHPDYEFGKRNFMDKAKAGRLKLLKYLRNHNVLCVFLDGMIGSSIIGRYGKIHFIILIRHWSECSRSSGTFRFEKFMKSIDEIHPEFIKIYFCTLEENKNIHKDIEKYNKKYEKTMLYYFDTLENILENLKELNNGEEFNPIVKSYDIPFRKLKGGIIQKLKNIGFKTWRSFVFNIEFDIFKDYDIGYPGFEYYGIYDNYHFIIKDE
ncbi:7959_t:CDS:1, partial [Scutellospora calospora]